MWTGVRGRTPAIAEAWAVAEPAAAAAAAAAAEIWAAAVEAAAAVSGVPLQLHSLGLNTQLWQGMTLFPIIVVVR